MMTADMLVRKDGFGLHESWPLRNFDEPTQGHKATRPHCSFPLLQWTMEKQPVYNLNGSEMR